MLGSLYQGSHRLVHIKGVPRIGTSQHRELRVLEALPLQGVRVPLRGVEVPFALI